MAHPTGKPLLILGARDLAPEVADIARDIPGQKIAGFVENLERERTGKTLDGLPVFWIDDLKEIGREHCAVCALSTPLRNGFIKQAGDYGVEFTVLQHPTASVASTAQLGPGVILNRAVVVAAQTKIGAHVFVNRTASIGHNTEIGAYATIQPGATIAGFCKIGVQSRIGMRAIIMERLEIGDGAIVGAGSMLTKDLPAKAKAVGMPARIIATNIVLE